MRIPSGKVDQVIYFVAVDSATGLTRQTGLSSFTVYRSRNGGTATVYTTPTISELSAANMPGVYSLLIDEDTSIASTSDSEEYCVHITQASMAAVTRTCELYRYPVTTGRVLDVSAGGEAGVDWANVGSPTTTVDLSNTTIKTTQKVDVDTIKTNPVVNGGTITFPTTATLASTTNITAGTVTTATNVTTVNGLAANVITATSIAADAITAAKVADGTIDAATFAAGAINAAAIAADAIGASELATDAVTEIVTGVLAGVVEGTTTVAQSLRLANSANASKLSGAATTTVTVRDIGDTKDRIVATLDASGNRSAITLDVT